MRATVVGTLVLALCACATGKLALAPPASVNLSGHWHLNEEESDDPLRLVQSVDPSKVTTATGPGQGQGGQGGGGPGRGGGRSRGGGFGGGPIGPGGPTMPGVSALGDGLRWPGKDLEIKQVAGVVAISSGGLSEVYQPLLSDTMSHRRKPGNDDGPRSRDLPDREPGGPPSQCGWDDKTLVIKAAERDEDHPPFEQRYSLSEDGQRLIEVVGFTGGRANGFTMSRTWERTVAASQATPLGVPSSH